MITLELSNKQAEALAQALVNMGYMYRAFQTPCRIDEALELDEILDVLAEKIPRREEKLLTPKDPKGCLLK